MSDVAGYLDVLKTKDLLPPTTITVLVTGSTARGWAHGNSDVDLIVVTDQPFTDDRLLTAPIPLKPPTLDVFSFDHDGRRWEVKYWLDTQITQLFDKVSWDQYDAEKMTGLRLTLLEEHFLAKFATNVPLDESNWHRRRIDELQASAFRSFMTTTFLDRSDSLITAALGQLDAGDPDGAALTVREAFGASVDALLGSVGEYSSGVKWRCRRFRAAEQTLLPYGEYWAIETMRDYPATEPRVWIERVATLCKELSMEIEV